MAKALLAGIAEGIGGVAAAAAGTNARQLTGTDFGGGTFGQTTQVDTGGIAAAGAFGGAQNAASIVADFYLREAQSIFPVISIPPGRRVSISFLRGTSLKWENQGGLFREELTPQ